MARMIKRVEALQLIYARNADTWPGNEVFLTGIVLEDLGQSKRAWEYTLWEVRMEMRTLKALSQAVDDLIAPFF